MLSERYFPAEEDMVSDENSERLNLVVSSFEFKLGKAIRGENAVSVLFEGDFDLSQKRNNGFHIEIGSGHTVDQATLTTRFLREMGRKGRISSTDFIPLEIPINGDTNAANYHRTRTLFTQTFPVERIRYKLDASKSFNLVVYRDRFFDRFFQDGKKGNPILERWHTTLPALEKLPEGSFGAQLALPSGVR